MKYHKIPHSNLEVSKIALGTMTYGEQNTQKEALEQLDYALERGVNLIDTAEMYPVPPKP
ncbi:MAG: aldo/keto reductase, partial [Vibrio litoralis]